MDGEERDPDDSLERVQAASLTARVPDGVAAGVFATGTIVLQSPTEAMIDFVQGVANPRRIGARVVMPHAVAVQFCEALASNIGLYESTFGHRPREPEPVRAQPDEAGADRTAAGSRGDDDAGKPPASPAGSERPGDDAAAGGQQPIADAYDQLKATDEVLGGVYANTVTISHTGSEFHFDFIMRCFPRSIVTARVYMAAPRAPALLDSLRRSLRLS
ncbi:MAG: DUF3467 domain-containing protein [Pirellulales bacterium]